MIQGRCIRCGHSFESESAAATIVRCPACDVPVAPGAARRVPLLTRDDDGSVQEVGDVLLSSAIVDGYRLQKVVGSGATGVVYEAVQLGTDRLVAVKLFTKPEDPRLRDRFLSEGKILSRIAHGNVVRLYDLGETDGHPYLVTEYLSGGTLRTRLDGGALDLRRALRIAQECLDGLAACHAQGVVHRDLKPENILFDERDVAKIADLGLARLVDSERRLTRAGAVLGTPRYMAPEQVMGQDATPASDIYSFGAVLYEMIAGRPPFSSERLADVLRNQLVMTPDPLDQISPAVPAEIARLVDAALSKNPAVRPPSATEFWTGLAGFRKTGRHKKPTLKSLPVQVPAADGSPRSSGRIRRPSGSQATRITAFWIVAALPIIVVGLVTGLWLLPGPRPSPEPVIASPSASSASGTDSPSPATTPAVDLPVEFTHALDTYNRLFKTLSMDFVGMMACSRETAANPDELAMPVHRLVDALTRWISDLDQRGLAGPAWLLVEGPLAVTMECVSGLAGGRKTKPLVDRLFKQIGDCVRSDVREPYRRLISETGLVRLDLEREWTTRALEAAMRVAESAESQLAQQSVGPRDRGMLLACRVSLLADAAYCVVRLPVLSSKFQGRECYRRRAEIARRILGLAEELAASPELFASCRWGQWDVVRVTSDLVDGICRSAEVEERVRDGQVTTVARLVAGLARFTPIMRKQESTRLLSNIAQIEEHARRRKIPFHAAALRRKLGPSDR